MRFDSYTYLWPPRPEKPAPPSLLKHFEQCGYVAQHKLNGTCNVIAVPPDRSRLVCMNRHADEHKAWQPTAKSSAAFRALRGKGWWVFVAELMHSKVPGIRDVNFLNEVLVADGVHLSGTTFIERQQIINDAFARLLATAGETDSHFDLDGHTWIAKLHTQGFSRIFKGLTRPEHEGLVLKDPRARLVQCGRPSANAKWQVKVRRPHENYAF